MQLFYFAIKRGITSIIFNHPHCSLILPQPICKYEVKLKTGEINQHQHNQQGAKLQNRLGKKHNTHAAEWRKSHMNVIILNNLKRSVFGHSPVTVIGVIMCQNCKE